MTAAAPRRANRAAVSPRGVTPPVQATPAAAATTLGLSVTMIVRGARRASRAAASRALVGMGIAPVATAIPHAATAIARVVMAMLRAGTGSGLVATASVHPDQHAAAPSRGLAGTTVVDPSVAAGLPV